MVARIVFGLFAAVALLFGAALIALYVVDWPLPADVEEWGLIPGPLAFGIWCGGLSHSKDFTQQLRLGGLCMILLVIATTGVGHVVALLAGEGARDHLIVGVYGAVHVVVAVSVVWAAAKNRWPVPEAG
ncbi:hypothetical protein [Lentzea flava]|uniref:Uncharacterized protein n=1 Tax=Lentzea flava TaxID=103732 RepID=A0ABQ2UIK6_9PSEU|nr:hypothetical protein [Lentzea flava]MCP2199711.1 hypothetical protein [Lentzea flava]GGU38830.1 hypothetical protein GCM10010178_33980 [Lentzea flava]